MIKSIFLNITILLLVQTVSCMFFHYMKIRVSKFLGIAGLLS